MARRWSIAVINVTSGGRRRLSTFVAGAFLLFLLAVLGPWVGRVPMPALVAVMIMVSIGTFSWNSIPNLRRHPPTSSVVMLTTVAVVVTTHDLSLGKLAGVLLSGIFFAGKVQRMFAVEREVSPDGRIATYRVRGEIFFASIGSPAPSMPRIALTLSPSTYRARTSGTFRPSVCSTRSSRACAERHAKSKSSDTTKPVRTSSTGLPCTTRPASSWARSRTDLAHSE